MARSLDQLKAEALELPKDERAQLALKLIESLDDDAWETPAEIDRAWEEEIQRRVEEFHAGDSHLIDSAEVFAQARSRIW